MARFAIPKLSREENQQLLDFWHPYEEVRAKLQNEMRSALEDVEEFAPILKSMTPEAQEANERRSQRLQRAAIVEGKWEEYLDDLRTQGSAYANLGLSFSSWYEAVRVFRNALLNELGRTFAKEPTRLVSSVKGMDRFVDIAMAGIGEAYLNTKQDIITRQQEAIREISTPVLQVRHRMLILPIIGLVDSHRARQLTEGLLHAIRERRARVVVMDITGVPIVDSKVANHFMQTVDAARLMGATVIVTGVSPQIAQTLVTLGVNLGTVRTLCDLQEGIEEGERLLGIRMITDANVATLPDE